MIKLSTCLILGILIGYYFSIPNIWSLVVALGLIFCLGTSLLIAEQRFKKDIYFGILTYLSCIALGILATNFHNEKRHKSHYTKHLVPQTDIRFSIRSVLKAGRYHDKYIIEILSINKRRVCGKALLNIERDSSSSRLAVASRYLYQGDFQELNKALNPHQFDYKAYLEKQYVYKQLFVKSQGLFTLSPNPASLLGAVDRLRQRIYAKLDQQHFSADVLAVIKALLLGQRQDLSRALYSDYAKAGAIHILAVSGLHVGIVMMLVHKLLSPFGYSHKAKVLKLVCIIILLWSFAGIASFSASVTRAATMFSLVAIGMHIKRPTSVYNSLVLSLFLLLIIRPLFLFDVGFQLSYLAVLAIVSIQPLLVKIWQPRFLIVQKAWNLFSVSLAAQLGVMPLSLYYFHQFPSLFFLANLIIIPCLGFVLGFGFLMLMLSLLELVPQVFTQLYGQIIHSMNRFVHWIARQEQFLFEHISFDAPQVVLTYLLLISGIGFLKYGKFRWLTALLLTICLNQALLIYNIYATWDTSFIIFHKSRQTVIAQKKKRSLYINSNLDSLNTFTALEDYKVAQRIKVQLTDSLQPIYRIADRYLLRIDSLGVYPLHSIKPYYVLLCNSPKINLRRLLDSIEPKIIIADGSNFRSYITRWKTICKREKLPFHYTGEKGAFIIRSQEANAKLD